MADRPSVVTQSTIEHTTAGSLWFRAVIALVLLVGFYALALGIAGGLLYLMYLVVIVGGRIPVKLVLLAVIAAAAILWSILPRIDTFDPPGPRLDPQTHPRLFHVLREVADATGQSMPSEVYLVPEMNAWVASRGGVMGVGSRRIMGLGLPLLQLLSTAQLRAVLAHEFGHYHGGDVKLGPWIYQTRAAIGRTIQTLHQTDSSIMHVPFEWYGAMFLRVTHGISRHQEFLADALAARVAGTQPLIEGLKAIHGGALAYDAYLYGEVVPVLQAGFRPPLAEGFARFMGTKALAEEIEQALDRELTSGETDPFDTHPALPERIAAIEAIADLPAGSAAEEGPAVELLTELDSTEEDLFAHMIGVTDGVERPKALAWDEVGPRVYAEICREAAENHAKHVKGITLGTVPTTRDAFVRWARDAGMPIEDADNDDIAKHAAHVFGLLVLHRMVEAGWTLQALPGEPIVALRDDQRFAPAPLLAKLAAGELDGKAWRAACEDAKVVDLPL